MKPPSSDAWRNPNRASKDYGHDLFNMLLHMFKDVENVSDFTARVLNNFEFIQSYSWQAAQRMVTGRYQAGARTWRSAAATAGQGSRIHTLLTRELAGPVGVRVRELIADNAKLIRSLPLDVARHATAAIATHEQSGERFVTSIPALLQHVSRTRAALIARTETSKAVSALTTARSEDLGVRWYVWRTSEDARVRRSHRLMEGVLVLFGQPPSPERLAGEKSEGYYNAGNIWNCRCYEEPFLRYQQVLWPCKVYFSGSVQRMTLAGFRRLNGNQQPVAA